MIRAYLLLLSLFAFLSSNAQDVITKIDGNEILAKVLEVSQNEIKYRKYKNLDGPIYSVAKSDISSIRYVDGSKDIFNEIKTIKNDPKVAATIVDSLKLVDKGSSVFITSNEVTEKRNESILVHAKRALTDWGYWKIADNITDADILAIFKMEQKGFAYKCSIEIVDLQTKNILLKTKNITCYAADYGNPRKAAVEQSVRNELATAVKKLMK